MAGFAGMHEKRGRAGARQGGGNLVADVTRFAHAGDDDAAAAMQDHFAGILEILIQAFGERDDRLGFGLQYR